MTWANEGKNHNGKPKKPELLPMGEKAQEIIEMLAAMYQATHKPQDATNDDDRAENANQ